MSAISPYLLVDQGFDSVDLGGLAVRLRGLRSSDLVGYTLPTIETGMEGDQSVVYLDEDAVQDLGAHLSNDTMDSSDRCDVVTC